MTHLNIILLFPFIRTDFVFDSIQIDRNGTDDSQFPWLPANTEFIMTLIEVFVTLFAVLTVEWNVASQYVSSSTKSGPNTKTKSFFHKFSFHSHKKDYRREWIFPTITIGFYTDAWVGNELAKQWINYVQILFIVNIITINSWITK